MSIQDNVKAAVKEAMRAKDKSTLQTLRMLTAAFKQIEIDKNIEVTDAVAMAELVRQVKQRQDAAKQFHEAGRDELAANEEAEIAIIQRFLPEQLSAAEVHAEVDAALAASGLPHEMASMGKVMGVLKPKLQGRADMAEVSKYLRQQLQA